MTHRCQPPNHGNLVLRATAALMALCMWSAVPAGSAAATALHMQSAISAAVARRTRLPWFGGWHRWVIFRLHDDWGMTLL
ncbi:MAG: hypothetical protein E6Q40_06965 [Cupriavidus sp.]|nr:MAG: hypothetical protein E6Q40_06965 [Cupriavidus sp.]